jgi:hypothetical protein
LLGESRELGELDGEQRCCGLCGCLDAADVVPRLQGAGPLGAVVGCRHQMAGQEEEVVDLVVGGKEALSCRADENRFICRSRRRVLLLQVGNQVLSVSFLTPAYGVPAALFSSRSA